MVETTYQQKSPVQKILDRQKQNEEQREPYDDRFADIVDFVCPGLTAWKSGEGETEGHFRGEKIYEGTPPWALRIMTDGWLGNLVSEALRWFKYVFSDRDLRDNDDVNQYLQDREDHMYSVYRKSELYAGLSPFTRAAFSVGSPAMISYEDKKEKTIKFEIPHPRENYYGPYKSYHRKYKLTALQAVKKFLGGKLPEDTTSPDAKLTAELLNSYKNGRHGERYTFIRAVYQKDDPILDGVKQEYKNKPWMEFYIQYNIPDTDQFAEPLLVQGYWTKPYTRWDYEINSDELYSRTPSWHAMMDIRSGQEFARQLIEAGQRSLNPPMWVQRKYRGRLHLAPKGITVYDRADERLNIPMPIQENINYNLGADVHDKITASVERWFQVELFSLLSRIAKEKAGWPTATHIIHLGAEKATLLSPNIGRFTHVIREIDNRCQMIEHLAGRMPPMPDILLEYMAYKRVTGETKVDIDVELVGPLAQMQQRGLALGRVEAGLAIQKTFLEIDPLLVHKTRNSVALEKALEQVGYPQDAIVPETEYQDTLESLAEAEREAKMGEQAVAAADAVPKLSKTIEAGSPLGTMMEAAEETV